MQNHAVWEIAEHFGDDFVYTNPNGNPAIAKPVLHEFQRLTSETVVWERGGRYWRRREDYDELGRRSSG